jgi:hypothetical protein
MQINCPLQANWPGGQSQTPFVQTAPWKALGQVAPACAGSGAHWPLTQVWQTGQPLAHWSTQTPLLQIPFPSLGPHG